MLAHGTSRSKGDDVIELRRLCGKHRIVPTSYKLEGVERKGEHPQHLSKVAEIWKGGWNGEVVALKVLKVDRDDPHMQRVKSVSAVRSPEVVLTDGVAVLQGSGADETVRTQECSPFLWGIDYGLRLLPRVSLVQKREHHGLSEDESRNQSIPAGQYALENHALLPLTCAWE